MESSNLQRHRAWLDAVRTRSARYKIRQFLKENAHILKEELSDSGGCRGAGLCSAGGQQCRSVAVWQCRRGGGVWQCDSADPC